MDDSALRLDDLLEHRAWVRALARTLVRDPGTADDLEQETWVAALESPPAHGGSPRGWLATVMRNRLRDRWRSESRRGRREEAVARAEAEPATADLAARADEHRRLIEAVLALPAESRDVVLERWFEGREPKAIAGRLGISASTVRSRLHRAVARLREDLDARHGGDGERWRAALLPLAALPDAGPAGGAPAGPAWPVMAASGAAVCLTAWLGWSLVTGGAPPPVDDGGRALAVFPADDTDLVEDPPPAPAAPSTAAVPGDTGASPALPVRGLAVLVRDAEGNPLRGVRVDPWAAGDAKSGWVPLMGAVAFSDAEGRALPIVEPGMRVRILATAEDLAAISEPFVVGEEGSTSVALELVAAVRLHGTVLSEERGPVAGARVRWTVDLGDDGELGRTALVDAAGAWSIDGLPARLVERGGWLAFSAPGHLTQWSDLEPPVVAGPHDVRLAPAMVVVGRCVDDRGRAVAAARVGSMGPGGSATTGDDGRFRVDGMERKDATLQIDADRFATVGVPVAWSGTSPVDIGDVVLRPGQPLRGVVVDRAGAPVKGASVNVMSVDVDQFVGYTGTDADGRFTVENLGPGEHHIWVSRSGDAMDFPLTGTLEGAYVGGEEVRVVVSSALALRVELVDDLTGEPVLAHDLNVTLQPQGSGSHTSHGTFSDDGVSRAMVSFPGPGAHTVTVKVDGFEPWVAEDVHADPDGGVVIAARLRRKP